MKACVVFLLLLFLHQGVIVDGAFGVAGSGSQMSSTGMKKGKQKKGSKKGEKSKGKKSKESSSKGASSSMKKSKKSGKGKGGKGKGGSKSDKSGKGESSRSMKSEKGESSRSMKSEKGKSSRSMKSSSENGKFRVIEVVMATESTETAASVNDDPPQYAEAQEMALEVALEAAEQPSPAATTSRSGGAGVAFSSAAAMWLGATAIMAL